MRTLAELADLIDEAALHVIIIHATLHAARCFRDTLEETGNNDGPLIEMIQRVVDGKAQREPYCAAFVNAVIGYVEYRLGVKSRLFASEHVMTMWNNTPTDLRVANPQPGDLIFYNWRGSSAGHVEVISRLTSTGFETVGANTNSGSKDFTGREGQGIFIKNRPRGNVGDMMLVGFISPFKDYRPTS